MDKVQAYFNLQRELKEAIFRTVSISDRLYAVIFFCEDTNSIRTRVLTRGQSTPMLLLEDLTIDELVAYTNIQKKIQDTVTNGVALDIENDPSAAAEYTESVNS